LGPADKAVAFEHTDADSYVFVNQTAGDTIVLLDNFNSAGLGAAATTSGYINIG
jgi:hypothetical protein